MENRFFGYGSLVNRATQDYPGADRARLCGWRRVWVHLPTRPLAYLSIRPGEAEIDGLVAMVPGADWQALDRREAAYLRHRVAVAHRSGPLKAQVYVVPDPATPAAQAAILLSYLDVVVQGYAREFGPRGVADFFATTDGWDAPVLDDRAAPRYARAQRLAPAERRMVDAALIGLGCRIVRLWPPRSQTPD